MIQPFGIAFASTIWEDQFADPQWCDPRVRALALELGMASMSRRNKILIVTGVYRTKEKNTEIYGYDKQSGHRELPSRAIDFGVKNLTVEDKMFLKDHAFMFLFRGAGCRLLDEITHFHLQVPHDYYNKIEWEVPIV